MNLLSKVLENFDHLLDRISGAIFLAIVALVVGNIIFRYFGHPLDGCHEWVGFLMISAISLALAYCAAKEGHVAVTILFDRLPRKKRVIAESIINIVILIFLLMIVRMLVLYSNKLYTGGHVAATTRVPMHYFAYISAIGFLGYSVAILRGLGKLIKEVIQK